MVSGDEDRCSYRKGHLKDKMQYVALGKLVSPVALYIDWNASHKSQG